MLLFRCYFSVRFIANLFSVIVTCLFLFVCWQWRLGGPEPGTVSVTSRGKLASSASRLRRSRRKRHQPWWGPANVATVRGPQPQAPARLELGLEGSSGPGLLPGPPFWPQVCSRGLSHSPSPTGNLENYLEWMPLSGTNYQRESMTQQKKSKLWPSENQNHNSAKKVKTMTQQKMKNMPPRKSKSWLGKNEKHNSAKV